MPVLFERIASRPLFRLCLVVVLAQLFDVTTFLVMITRHGIEAEINPIVHLIIEHGGLVSLMVVKSAVCVLAIGAILWLAPYFRTIATVVGVIAIGVGILGGVSNGAFLT